MLLPLITHAAATDVLAWRGGLPIPAAQFLADVAALRERLPPGLHMLNVCHDRYRFAVGLGAALLAGKVSLLPSTHTPAVIRDLLVSAPDAFCLTDDTYCAIDMPLLHVEPTGPRTAPLSGYDVPGIAADQIAAFVFTSGSTGSPVAHRKTWGRLVRCVRDGALRLGLDRGGNSIVATVPAQHMYGFESSVLIAMQTANALCAEKPLHPAEVRAVLQSVPEPRTLVTTPVHLRSLRAADTRLPPLQLIVCATAPLSQQLARDCEAAFAAPLLEIYGSTETGQIATRRSASQLEWELWPGVTLQPGAEGQVATGGHIEEPTPLQDVIEPVSVTRFLLHGRHADLVNIAGKRSSIAYLNHQLNAIAGVEDGSFLLPAGAETSTVGVTRLAAFAVAPGHTAASLLQALRDRIDPAFMPRPLLLVDQLPRNATGKLPRAALEQLLQRRATATQPIHVPHDHPSFAGHFPGSPLLPGALLLDEALRRLDLPAATATRPLHLAVVKFLRPVLPGTTLRLQQRQDAARALRFELCAEDAAVVSGVVDGPGSAS